MKHMKLFGVTVAAALAMASGVASAQGWYVSGNAGAVFLNENDSVTANDGSGNSITFDADFDPGFVVSGAAGYAWNALRAEGEVSYRQNDLDQFTVTNVTIAGIGSFSTSAPFDGIGDMSALGFMANVWYDIKTKSKWTPFVGAGLGVAQISLNDFGAVISGTDSVLSDDSDWVFAYQVGAGIGYQLSANSTVSVGYRFFATGDPEFSGSDNSTFEGEYKSHNFEIGYRYRF